MKVIVTGGPGFIGSHIVDMLINKGYEVAVIDNLVHGKLENLNRKASFYKFNILDKRVSEVFNEVKPDLVIHEAAHINVENSIKNPMYDAEVNILGTLNILECCRMFGIKKIIYPSSAAIFGNPVYLPIDENHPLNMVSDYGVTKHTVEHYLKVYKELYGIDYVVLRYSNVYGPRQDSSGEGGVIAIFCERISQGIPPCIYGDGEQIRDFVFVKDVASANILALESDKIDIFNVCTNSKISINDLFGTLSGLQGSRLEAIRVSPRSGDIRTSYMSYSLIYRELGWSPQYSLHQGLKETLEYYKDSISDLDVSV